jgi:hypothetical protein
MINYRHYENKIVKPLGVALDGWPLPGNVRNPGDLTRDDLAILRNALDNGQCKWVILTPQQVSDREARDQEHEANGEVVDGQPSRKRARKNSPISSDKNRGDHDVGMDNAALQRTT